MCFIYIVVGFECGQSQFMYQAYIDERLFTPNFTQIYNLGDVNYRRMIVMGTVV
jgi:hypothetical protein